MSEKFVDKIVACANHGSFGLLNGYQFCEVNGYTAKGTGEYNGTKYQYYSYKIDDVNIISLWNVIPCNGVLEIPDDINGIPVMSVGLDYSLTQDSIKKIIIGNNLVYITNYSKCINDLSTVVIKKDYSGTGTVLAGFITSFIRNSVHMIDFQFENDSNYKIKNKCLISKDEKDLFLIFERDNIIVPDKVEHIHSKAFMKNAKVTSTIKWPNCLKIIDNLSFNKYSFDKLLARNPLPDTLEVLNASTIFNYITGNELYISKNIRIIDSNIIDHLINVNNINVDYYNENFIYENKLLLSKDKKNLILCLDKKNKNVLFMPESVENIWINAFNLSKNIKTIFLKNKNETLIKQIEDCNLYNRSNFKVEILQTSVQDKIITSTNKINTIPEYIIKKSKCYIANDVTVDILEVGISNLPETNKKTFVITKECANIKQLIIPEGVTDIEIDSSCYSVHFNLEILELPSSCKFSNILEPLDSINSFMMLIINPIKKPRWMVHKLSYVVACKSNFSMPKGVFEDYDSYYGMGSQEYSIVNEITYIKNFDKEKLIITDNAYYYINNISKKEVGLLKVKNVPQYSIPEKVDKYKVKKVYDYCYAKFNGTEIISENDGISENEVKLELSEKTKSIEEFEEGKEYSVEELFNSNELKQIKKQIKSTNFNLKPKFNELKGIIHFISNEKTICNVELEFDQDRIPLLFEHYPDETSIFLSLRDIVEDKNFVKNFLKEEFDININEFNKLADVEKALIIFKILFQNCYDYWFNISSSKESKIYLKNTIGNSKIVEKIFDQKDEEKSPIIINILPNNINRVSESPSFNIDINLNTMEVFLDELFMFAEGDLEDYQIFAYNMFSYHFDDVNEVINMDSDHCASTLLSDELSYFGDLTEDGDCVVTNVESEEGLLKWICEEAVTNVILYNNSNLVLKLPSYLFRWNNTSEFIEEQIHNNGWFDKTKCPNVIIHLMEYFIPEKNNGDCQDNISNELKASKTNSISKDKKIDINDSLDSSVENKNSVKTEKTLKKNNGYTASNTAILNARDFVSALDLASNCYSNNHNEEEAKEYSKKMKITLSSDHAIYALDENNHSVSATFSREKGVQFSCYCNEYKTKTNPCIHIRALYYLLLDSLSQSNTNASKKRNSGYTAKNEAILSAPDFATAMHFATKDFLKNHSVDEAIEYSKKIIVNSVYTIKNNCIHATSTDNLTINAQFSKEKGVHINCNCNEFKTKSNPCVHSRALYYSLLKKLKELNLENTITKNDEVEMIEDTESSVDNCLINHIETSVKTTNSTYKTNKFDFGKLDGLVSILGLVSFISLFVAIICSYCTTATLTMYATYKGQIAGRAMYTEFNIGKSSGFFFVLMYLTAAISLFSKFFIANKEKEFIPFVISSITSFIAGITFASCMSKYNFVNDITYIPYYEEFKTIEESCIVSGPGGFVTFLFISIAIIFAIIAFIKYKKEN